MKNFTAFILSSIFVLTGVSASAQLERVFIEKYYLSDANDATDTTGGILPTGSTTYRIYVDMAPGFRLKKLYGDDNHPFIVRSTETFYNHAADGQTFAKDFVKARYSENIVALDSWLTIGQTTKTQAGKTYFGIPKESDTDGSFIGGENNDGGSAMISGGLLTNADPSCGSPLTLADGMDTLVNVPTTWFSLGVADFVTGADSTIFGSLNAGTEFNSRQFELRNTGTVGVLADSNHVLIAQLTTAGELSFNLNLEIEGEVNGELQTFTYVGSDSVLVTGETYNPFLIYPLECGCNDPLYLEFDPTVGCLEAGSCITPIIYGCMDSMACNFDPQSNFNVQGLCCYPGLCNGRDIAQVCPSLLGESFELEVFPNPSNDDFTLNIFSGMSDEPIHYEIVNTYGVKILSKDLSATEKVIDEVLEFSNQQNGLYHLIVTVGGKVETMILVKSN
jgi:hypothetical protein